MGRSLFAGVLLVAACGRMEFDPRPWPHERVLECGAPVRFAIDTDLTTLNAIATPVGFVIVGVDGAGDLRGWTYEWTYTALEPRADDVLIGRGVTTTTGMAAVDKEIVIAAVYGDTTPLGTQLYALDKTLSPRAPMSSRVGVMAGEGPLARGGGAATDIALIDVDSTKRVDARRIDTRGADLAPARMVVEPGEDAGSVRLAPAKDGYVLSWTSAAGSPNCTRVARLDRDLALAAGPVSVQSGADENAIRAQVAWLPGADRYLVTWFEKAAGTGDDVWFQILDGALAPVVPARRLAPGGVRPQVATDGEQFFVAWRSIAGDPTVLAAAAIDPDGAVTMREVPTSGGEALGHALVERNGQVVLAWSESGADGPDLWLDPMCP